MTPFLLNCRKLEKRWNMLGFQTYNSAYNHIRKNNSCMNMLIIRRIMKLKHQKPCITLSIEKLTFRRKLLVFRLQHLCCSGSEESISAQKKLS